MEEPPSPAGEGRGRHAGGGPRGPAHATEPPDSCLRRIRIAATTPSTLPARRPALTTPPSALCLSAIAVRAHDYSQARCNRKRQELVWPTAGQRFSSSNQTYPVQQCDRREREREGKRWSVPWRSGEELRWAFVFWRVSGGRRT